MTATLTPATFPAVAPAATRWASVAEGLWAGTREGEFFGTVEFVEGGFETTDHRGTRLGRSHSLAAAKRLLDEPVDEQPGELMWRDDRATLAVGWLGFATLAVAAIAIATQLFV